MPRKTPLFNEHEKLHAKMIDFGGWLMPVSYAGVLSEHKNVRENVGIFDVSHMGEIFVSGPNAENLLQYLTINDVNKIRIGASQYTAMLDEQGGFIDDLIIYKLAEDRFLLCVNAANVDKDFDWIKRVNEDFAATVENQSDTYSQIAVQGPKSQMAMEMILNDSDKNALKEMQFGNIIRCEIQGKPAYLARTGYTGEHGYEIYLPNESAEGCWQALLKTKEKTMIEPIGLGARDTLRLEACYLLYGNDMDEKVTPYEAGIDWAVKLNCGEFIGKGALEDQVLKGIPRTMVAFKMIEPGIPRHGMDLYKDDELVGKVTSGSFLPTLAFAGGMALVSSEKVRIGDELRVDVRGKRRLASIIKKPLYGSRTKT